MEVLPNHCSFKLTSQSQISNEDLEFEFNILEIISRM